MYDTGQQTWDAYATCDAINQARADFHHQLQTQEGFRGNTTLNGMLRALQPKIGELIVNFEDPLHQITIADCGETKYIICLSSHGRGLKIGTKGFYNADPVQRSGNSITSSLSEHMPMRRGISRDLRSIQTDIRQGGQ